MPDLDVVAISRETTDFQQPVDPSTVAAILRRALDEQTRILRVVEIGVGTYNNTYRVDRDGADPVYLRIAPELSRQGHRGRDAMRNEHAATPFLSVLGPLVPRTLAVDFTHRLLDRDYMVQTAVPGTSAAEVFSSYSAPAKEHFYRELGCITRTLHDVRGPWFGPVGGPGESTWSAALIARYRLLAEDYADAGLGTDGIERLITAVSVHRGVLDQITEPHLLHGDLWHLNILVDSDPDRPTITGIVDYDAAYWGDRPSDWTINRVQTGAGTEADAFWDSYGTHAAGDAEKIRAHFYRARNLLGARLDIHRRGLDLAEIPPVYWDLTPVLDALS